MDRPAAIDLQRRVLTAFVRVLGGGSEGSAVFERDGVIASVVPAVPERSVINSVVYRDTESLRSAIDDLARTYEEAGVLAWTVWVPETERDAAAALEAAGHVLDGRPTAMLLDLAGLPEPERDDLDWDAAASPADVGRVNDLAYGLRVGSFGGALTRLPPDLPLRLYQARVEGEPACVLGTLDDGDDCGVYLVATLSDHRGRGLARRLLHIALAESRERGCLTSTLQSSNLGYPVYERLGYEPVCALEMWERRKPAAGGP
jgi:GNAT superfamily N-acetyltransferase